jgi:hypothetical protein
MDKSSLADSCGNRNGPSVTYKATLIFSVGILLHAADPNATLVYIFDKVACYSKYVSLILNVIQLSDLFLAYLLWAEPTLFDSRQ